MLVGNSSCVFLADVEQILVYYWNLTVMIPEQRFYMVLCCFMVSFQLFFCSTVFIVGFEQVPTSGEINSLSQA